MPKTKKVEELDSVEQRNKENGEVVGGEGHVVSDPFKGKNESKAEYIERVPIGVQPAAEAPKLSYLGKPL